MANAGMANASFALGAGFSSGIFKYFLSFDGNLWSCYFVNELTFFFF